MRRSVDTLAANEFEVEIEGERVGGIFRISNLATFKVDHEGNRIKAPFEIAKMVQRDANAPFNRWLRETTAAKHSGIFPRRQIAILAVDDGIEIRRWTVRGAWIQSVTYSEFNSASFEMVEEIVTLMYDDIEETWSATPDLE